MQGRHQMTQGQIQALNKGRLDLTAQAAVLQTLGELGVRAAQHLGVNIFQVIARADLEQLAVQQVRQDLPDRVTFASWLCPLAEMRGQRVEVLTQAITGEDRHIALVQSLDNPVNQSVDIRLGAPPDMLGYPSFAERILCRPHPDPLARPTHFVHQLIHLNVCHHQVLEQALMQHFTVPSAAL
jgi:hypothetical protein